MAAVIVYGSLINPKQLQPQSVLFSEIQPVLVKGYKRTFNQEPSWRKSDSEHRAVLNVIRSDQDCFNGLLVKLQDSDNLSRLDERERGYHRAVIAPSQLSCLANVSQSEDPDLACSELAYGQTYLYLGRLEKQNNNILPNKRYLNICLQGAQHWGEAFYEQFLQTTYVGELTLKTFLQLSLE